MTRVRFLLAFAPLSLAMALGGCATTGRGGAELTEATAIEGTRVVSAEHDRAAAGAALLADTVDQLPEPNGSCGQVSAQRALVTAQLLGIAGVPFLIAPDGRLHQGVPADLEAWLEGNQ